MKRSSWREHRAARLLMAALLGAAAAGQAHALQLDSGNPDLTLRWDNSIRYGAAFRVRKQDPALLALPNNDDGDRNFNRGLISNRLELLSELDAVSRSGLGARVSAIGWYDTVYNSHNDNPGFAGGAVPNQVSVANNAFTSTARAQHGRNAELRDAFVFVKREFGEQAMTVRLGQHGLVWGETIFFSGNGIAGAQSAFDVAKLQADPTAQAKEFVLPVPQVSAEYQVSPNVSLGAYYQARWKPNRFAAAGSYFANSDNFGEGGETLWVGPTAAVPHEQDLRARNSGQFGLQLRWRVADTDLGFYALRYHDKNPQIVVRLGPFFNPTGYYRSFQEGSSTWGFSASRNVGDANVALEASVRQRQGLASSGNSADLSAAFGGAAADNRDNPGYAVGKTAHVNLSTLWTLPSWALWNEAALIGEVAWNRMLSCNKNCAALDSHGTRDASALRFVVAPTYRQVLPGLDLSVPVGVGYSPKGSRSLALGPALPPENGGDITLGLGGVYEAVWNINLAFTHYYGVAEPSFSAAAPQYFTYRNSVRDRDFISFTLRRTF